MTRALPAYLLDDMIELFAREDYGGRLRQFSDKLRIPARVEQRTQLRDNAGRRRKIAYLDIIVSLSNRVSPRTFVSARKVRTGVGSVGDSVGMSPVLMPGLGTVMPVELDGEEVVRTSEVSRVNSFYVGDRLQWRDLNYEIDTAFERHSPSGPNHWELRAHEIGEGAE